MFTPPLEKKKIKLYVENEKTFSRREKQLLINQSEIKTQLQKLKTKNQLKRQRFK